MAERIDNKLMKSLDVPAKGYRIVYDGGRDRVKGFAARVTANGARAFIVNYRNAEGVERRMTIGTYPTWSVEAARKRAKALRQEIDTGVDPLAVKKEQREAPTIADLCNRYIDEHLPRKRPRSQDEDKSIIKAYIRPKLGKRKVAL